MAKVNEKVQIKSNLDSTLIHNGIEIEAGEMISVDCEIAQELIAKKFCTLVKVKAV
ncbi:MAG: hypothetical protein ACRCX2_03935 [Paraclostridium sp.]